jgi:hypothetical protein
VDRNSRTGIAETAALKPAFILSAALVVLLVAAAIPGVFISGLYHDPASIVATDRGSDLVTLFVVVPAVSIALFHSYRGSLRAQVIWLGLVSWALYAYVVYAFGLNFTPLFLVHVAIVSLAVFTLAIVLRRTEIATLGSQFAASMPRRIVAFYLWVVAAMFSFLWLADTIPASLGNRTPERLAALHSTSNPVEINDLAIIIPLLVLAGYWTWKRRAVGYLYAGVLLGLATATMAAIVPGAPIFGGMAVDPLYAGVAALSLMIWIVFLSRVRSSHVTAVRGTEAPAGSKFVAGP